MMRPHHRTKAYALASALMFMLLLGACTRPQDVPADIEFGHVHGLGLNPADDRLYVASHDGLFVIDDSGPRRVGRNAHDLMGFTITGPNQFLASGHPGGGDLPNPMGLVSSDDYAMTWKTVSLTGEADLHAIDTAGQRVVAYDSLTETVLSSNDQGRTFTALTQMPSIDLALMPSGEVLVTAPDGGVWLTDDLSTEQVTTAPPLAFIDGDTTLAGVSPSGVVWTSSDGITWSRRGELPEQPQAVSISDGRWFAATTTGVYESTDNGRTWESLL